MPSSLLHVRGGTLVVQRAGASEAGSFDIGARKEPVPGILVDARLDDVPGGKRLRVRVEPNGPVTLKRIAVELSAVTRPSTRVLMNGYQSWTETRERSIEERLPPIVPPLGWLLGPFGDYPFARYSFRRGVSHGFTYGYLRDADTIALAGALSEEGGYLVLEADARRGRMVLAADVAGCEIDAPLNVLDVFLAEGPEDVAFDAWFAAREIPRATAPTLAGWTSWYLHFTEVTEAHVHSVLRGVREHALPLRVVQLDDGYQTAVGDHLDVNRQKFPRGLEAVAEDIAEAGLVPGLWLAPFVCTTPSRLYRDRKSLLERDARGRLFRTGFNPWWKGDFYALDVDNPEARALVEQTLAEAMQMGFTFLKLDFLFAAALQHRKNQPRGRRMRDTMRWLRERTRGATLLGCGVPLGAALGLVEYCRIGSDVSPRWEDKLLQRMHYRERPSTRNSLASTVGRRHLDRRAFSNDADVFFLRRGNIKMTAEERRTLLLVNAVFSGLLFTSDDLGNYGPAERAAIEGLFPLFERKLLTVTERALTVDALVEVEGASYRLFANLSEDNASFSLPRAVCFEAERGVFLGGDVVLGPHRAMLVRIVPDGDVAIAGSPHLFPGADCTLERDGKEWKVSCSTRAPGEVVLVVRGDAPVPTVNGILPESSSAGPVRVVRLAAATARMQETADG